MNVPKILMAAFGLVFFAMGTIAYALLTPSDIVGIGMHTTLFCLPLVIGVALGIAALVGIDPGDHLMEGVMIVFGIVSAFLWCVNFGMMNTRVALDIATVTGTFGGSALLIAAGLMSSKRQPVAHG